MGKNRLVYGSMGKKKENEHSHVQDGMEEEIKQVVWYVY